MNKTLKNNKLVLLALVVGLMMSNSELLKAQKLKSTNLNFEFVSIPDEPLPYYIKTYHVEIKGDYKDDDEIKKVIIEKMDLNLLYTYEEDETKADLSIQLNMPKLEIIRREKKQATTGEGDNKETKYWFDYYYKMPVTLKMTFNKYKYKFANEFLFNNELKREGSTFNSADGYTMYEQDNTINAKHCFTDAAERIGKYFAKFAKTPVLEYDMIITTAKFKNENDDKLDLAADQTKNIFKSFDKKNLLNRELNEAEMQKVRENIEIWETILKGLDITSDKNIAIKDIYNGLKLNLVFSYILVNDFEKAWEHYSTCLTFKDQSGELKKLRGTLAGFFNSYQTKYIRNTENIDVADIIVGKWKTTAITSNRKLDINNDGKATNDMLKEGDICKLYEEYDFQASKNMIISQGDPKDCKVDVQDDLFWAVKKSNVEDRWYLVTGDEQNFDPNDGKPLLIKTISYNKIIISTTLYVNDTREPVEIQLSKIIN